MARAFKVGCRENKIKKASGQDAVQFFTDGMVSGRWPPGTKWAAVDDTLKAAKAFD